MRNWTETTLGEIVEFTNGGAWNQSEYADAGIPVVRVSDIHDETVRLDGCKFLPPSSLDKYRKHLLREGDVVVATVGSHPTQPGSVVGRVACVPRTANGSLLNQNAVRLAPLDTRIDRSYLRYFSTTQTFRNYIIAHARGSANQVRMAISALRKMPIALPTLSTQCRIAGILGAYDNLTENNTRRIELLEEMARTIYREWFVNFRFPGHEKTSVKSGKGQIPEGWQVQKVTDAVDVDPPTTVRKEGVKPFVSMGSLSHNSMHITDIEERAGNSGSKFRNGDTLFARITPCLENGKTGFVQFLPNSAAVGFGSTEFIVLRSRTVSPEYVYLMARSEEFRENAIKSMSGATGRQRVQEACFDRFFIAHPPSELLQSFQSVVTPMFRLAYVLSLKNENLRQTRDLLLPKLVSGEISLETAEAEVAAQGA